jgi:lactoylglutathione lyase
LIKNIATVGVYVEDQQKAKQFWIEKIGFEVVAEHPMGPDATWLEVAPTNAQSRLVIYPKSMRGGYDMPQVSIVFECENIEETYVTMKEKGVEFEQELNKAPWGTSAIFCDEDGNKFLIKGI